MTRTAPPSTANAEPVTHDARGDARNATTAATSSGVPMRPSGTRFDARSPAAFRNDFHFGPALRCASAVHESVSTGPGQTAFTRTPSGASSFASDFVAESRAAFAAE